MQTLYKHLLEPLYFMDKKKSKKKSPNVLAHFKDIFDSESENTSV